MKTNFLLLLSLLFCSSIPATAQFNSDSLWAIWSDETQPVETRLEALSTINTDKDGLSRKTTNPDTAFYNAGLMYDLAQVHGLRKYMGRGLRDKGNYHFKKGSFKEALDFYNQSKAIAKEIEDKDLIAGTSFNIGVVYLNQGNADLGLKAFSQATENYKAIGNKKKLSMCFDRTAIIYNFQKSDPKKALVFLNQSLTLKEELIKTNDNAQDRFILNGIKQTIKNINESLEEITDTIDLATYAPKEPEEKNSLKKDSKKLIAPDTESIKQNEEIALKKNPENLIDQKQDTTEQDNNDDVLEYLIDNVKKSKEVGAKRQTAENLFKIGVIHEKKNDLDNALKYYSQSLGFYEELKDKNLIGKSLHHIGRIYYSKGNFHESLNSLNRGRKLLKEVQNLRESAYMNNIIAAIYLAQEEYSKAIEINSENLAFFNNVGDKMNEAGSLSNTGSVYRNQGDNVKALENFNQALKIFEEINQLRGVAGVNLEIAELHLAEGNYELALKSKSRSLTISEKIGDINGILLAQGGIANIYTAQGKHSKAISFGNSVLVQAQKSGNIEQIRNSSKVLATNYKETGRYQKALEMNELYHQMQDSLQSKENQKAVIRLQFQSDYEKQKAIDDVENEKLVAIETQKKKNQQKLSFAIGLGLLLISLLALVIFNRLKLTRQQKEVIEEQKKKVEQSEKYKEQFLANMSHEIRTPMHAISGMVKILKRNEHLPKQDIFLDAMHTSSDNLVVILNDVLDLSKIEAGKLDIESIPMDPRAVIENVIQILKFKAEEKGLKLNYQVSEEVPDLIMGDPTRLNQILINLAGNAIKFTEKGSVDVLLKKENDKLKFSIKDTGIGISQDKVETIFEAFEQAKNSTSRYYGGTGLGLSISKQLVELQKGKIWAENNADTSTEGKGSIFYVELPLVAASVNAMSQDIITEDRLKSMVDSLEGIRILIAEDNPFNQMIAQDDLSYLIKNVKIDTVENGALAVEKFKTESYDLILMDVQMPEMNGFEATRKIREIEQSTGKENAIPIIAMTASLLKSDVQNCYDAGMGNYIPKPYQTGELIGPIYAELNQSYG